MGARFTLRAWPSHRCRSFASAPYLGGLHVMNAGTMSTVQPSASGRFPIWFACFVAPALVACGSAPPPASPDEGTASASDPPASPAPEPAASAETPKPAQPEAKPLGVSVTEIRVEGAQDAWVRQHLKPLLGGV